LKGTAIPERAWTDPDGSSSSKLPDFKTINEAGKFLDRVQVYDFTNTTVHPPLFSKLKYIFVITGFHRDANNISTLVGRYVNHQLTLPNFPEQPRSLKHIFQYPSSSSKYI
jgi:hypothetical protein